MTTDLQYMALSDLVYENIDNDKSRRSIQKIFKNKNLERTGTKNRWPTYKKHIGDWEFLEAYKPTELLDKKESELTFEEKSFYSAAFQSPNQDEIVIAYRGTDGDRIIDDRDKLLGIIDKDPDFWGEMIITNLGKIGLSIPGREFELAEKFYKNIYTSTEYDFNRISFTGHSLGGGLAQYASVISSDSEVNKAVTWNGIGIKSFTIISGYEFFDKPQAIIKRLYKEIDGEANKDDVEKEYRNLCDGIIKYFENLGYIEDYQITEQFLKEGENGKEIDEEKLDRALDNFRQKNNYDISSYILPPKTLKDIIDDICSDRDDYGKLDSCKNIKKRLDVKRKFINEYNESKNYSDSVINYVNPYDLTGNFADHIGSTYSIKDGMKNVDIKNILASYKGGMEFATQHSLDVFYPYFMLEKGGNGENPQNIYDDDTEVGDLTDNLSDKYMKGAIKSAVLQFCKDGKPKECLSKLLQKCIVSKRSIDRKFIPLIKSVFMNSMKLNSREISDNYKSWLKDHQWIDFHGGWIDEDVLEPIKSAIEFFGLSEDKIEFELNDTTYKLDYSILNQIVKRDRNNNLKHLLGWKIAAEKKEIILGEKKVKEEKKIIEYTNTDEKPNINNKEIRIEIPAEGKSLNVIQRSLWQDSYNEARDNRFIAQDNKAYCFKSNNGFGQKKDGTLINYVTSKNTDPDKKVKIDGSDISGTYKEKKAEEAEIGDRETSAGDRYFGDNIIYKESQNKLLYLYGSEKKNELVINGFKSGDYGIELKDMVPGEAKDKLKTYGDYYKLKFNELEFKSLDKLEVKKGINQHTEVNIAGQVEAEKYQETKEYLDKDFTPLYITYKEEDTNILFKGRLVEYDFYREEGGDAYLEARALSNSLKLKRDYESLAIDKQDRVYQVVGSTYTDIMDMIMEAHEKVDIKFQKSETGEETFLKEEHPVEMQYHENDWHFLKRVFSEYGKKGIPILVDDTKAEDEPVNIKIGFSKGESIKLSKEVYKQHRKGKLEKRDSGCGKQDGLYSSLQIDKFQHGKFSEKDRKKELLGVGKTVEIETGDEEKKEYKVIENRLYIPEDGFTLRSDLTLVEPKKLHMEKVKRERDIEGIAASAKVKKVKKDHTLQVKFEEMESEHNSDVYSYPIDKFYTGEYFAPEKGDIVDIYFGGKNEKDATVKSIRTSVKTINTPPKVKKIRTQEGKEIVIDDEDKSITFSGKDDEVNMYITEELIHFMRKDTKIIMKDDGIILRAGDREITISEDGLIARADGNKLGMIENCIIMENQSGAFVEVKDGKIKITDGQSKITMGDGDISINSAAMAKLG